MTLDRGVLARPALPTLNLQFAVALLCCAFFSATTFAQFDSKNISLLSRVSLADFGSGEARDCWGYVSPSGREYAVVCLNNGTAVVEITDPASPRILRRVSGNPLDVKVYRHYAYSAGDADRMYILDLSDVDNGNVRLANTLVMPTHNLAIDEESGLLYRCTSKRGGGFPAYDIATDPETPTLLGFSRSESHDALIVNYKEGPYAGRRIAYSFASTKGIDILDVTDNANPVFLVQRMAYPNRGITHQGWISEDLHYLYVNDEGDVKPTIVYDVSDPANPIYLYAFTNGNTATDHNCYPRDGLLYQANYKSGLRIFDIGNEPINPIEVGYFDTFPENDTPGFSGAWSVYPYFPSGNVIVSDINRGLFIFDVTAAKTRLHFEQVNELPEFVAPDGSTTLQIDITATNTAVMPGSVMLNVNDGDGWQSVLMDNVSGDTYEGVFPSMMCGSIVSYYVEAQRSDGTTQFSPAQAPNELRTTVVGAEARELFVDNFQSNQDWVVRNRGLLDGAWERGKPAGLGNDGDPLHDYDRSGRCYLTANRRDNSDVDGGPTELISPRFDLTNTEEPVIEYANWLANDDGDDRLNVDISNDEGANWTNVRSIEDTGGRWQFNRFRVLDFILPTDTMRLRFTVADNPNNSITEAGVDAVRILDVACAPIVDCLTLDVTNLVAGDSATFAVSNGTSGQTVAVLYGTKVGRTVLDDQAGWCADFGIDLPLGSIQKRVIASGVFDGSGEFQSQRAIPSGTAGLRVLFQAAMKDTCPTACMSNLVDEIVQ